ncbi:MAG: MFS transporter, partial [Candidatus Thermoplasmatota archaeon]|nr:MFS transporter [Candidatus Thermoplasmatota archaeon]
SMLESLKSQIENSRYSISIQGENNDTALAGIDHPTNLGDGPLDFIAKGMRDLVWQPLGISVTIQFLILGVLFGSIMGGCQGLSRSLFGKMVPETRSAEFFGFFGFFGKVAAFIGPLLYGTMVILFDDRVGILSIGLLIIIGTLMMRLVNVEEGIEDARLEDERNRAKSSN